MAGIFGDIGSAFDWTKKHVFNPVGHAVSTGAQDVAHFVTNDVARPVARFAENDVAKPVARFVNNDVVSPVRRDFVRPVLNLPQTVNNDFVRPINRDFVQPVLRLPTTLNNDLMPGSAKFTDFLKAVPSATKTVFESPAHIPLGNDVTTGSFVRELPKANADFWKAAPLASVRALEGAAEGVVNTPQFIYNGADWIANKVNGTKNIQLPGQSALNTAYKYIDKPFNYIGKKTDEAAKNAGLNMTAYHAAQVPASIATTFVNPKQIASGAEKAGQFVAENLSKDAREAALHNSLVKNSAKYRNFAQAAAVNDRYAELAKVQNREPKLINSFINKANTARSNMALMRGEARQRGAIGKNVLADTGDEVPKPSNHPLVQAFNKYYTPSKNPSAAEKFAADYIRNNPDQALKDYVTRVKKKFGSHKVVAGDEAKHIIPGFNSTKSVAYHEPGSALVKAFSEILHRSPSTVNQMVHIMSGGTGAGKTSALLKHFRPDDYAATIDTNGNKLDSAVKKIETALKSGRNVEYTHVHRDPIEAFREGVIPRTAKEGRLVTPEAHIDTHYGSNEVFQKLRELYNDNPNIRFNLLGNKTNEIPTVLENVPQMRYNRRKAYQQLIKEVENAYKQGKITKAERDVYLGKANTAAPKPEQNTGKSVSTEPNRPVRQEVTQKSQDIQKALDKPNLTAKQRQTLSAALEKEKAKASVAAGIPQKTLAGKVARGESRTPSRTTPIALSKTSQEAPLKSSSIKDIQASGSRQKLLSRPQTAKSKIGPKPTSHLTSSNSTLKQRGFTTSVKNSDEVSPTTRKNTSGSYEPRSTAKMALLADKYSQGGLKRVTSEVNDSLAKKTGTISDQEIANAIAVAKRNDAKGNFDAAQQIYDRLAEHGTKGGQQIQAFSLLRNRTPEGLHHSAIRQLKKVGVELDKTEQKELSSLIEDLRKTKIGTKERDVALHNVVDFVDRRIPSGLGEKLVNFWRAGLLTSPVTTGGNILGNATEAATRNLWTNPTATAIDKFFSLFTGKRTKTLTGGQLAGAKTGTTKGLQYLKTGFDERRAPNEKFDVQKRRVNFKNPILDKYVNGVYRWMGAQDQPFYYAAEKQAARDLATADAKNLKLKGQARIDYIRNAQSDPNWKPQTFKSKSTQKGAGEYAVYQNSTLLGHMAGGLKKYASEHSGVGGAVANFLLPFSQVPSSVAMRIVDRTPLGIAKEVVSQIKNRSFDQRAMSEAVANGTFALPVVAAGAALAKSGLITGAYPTDPKERKLWQSEGKQEYSVKVGNRWYSLNYMQPFGTLLAIGGQFQNDIADGKTPGEAWNKVGATALNSVENQSFLQGINGVLSAVNDPNRSASQYITSTASSVAPNFIRTAARATDPQQRDTKGAIQGVQGAIPGLREKLPAKQDMFGKNLPAYDNAANQMFNPLRPDIARNQRDPVLNELQRLQDTQNGIIPTQFDKSSISGVKLNDQQVRQLNALVNPKVYTAWESIIADPRYKALSDEDKATALKQAKDKIADAYKRQFMANNNIPITKAATASELGILSGQKPDYLAQTSVASSSATPMQKYQAALANYNSNSKNLSPVDKYKAQQSLVKLKVEAPYSNDIITLHGMSKTDASNWLSIPENGVDKAKMAKQLMAYDQALYNAGLEKSLKYKYGIAPTTRRGSRSSGRSAASSTLAHNILRIENARKAPQFVGASAFKPIVLPKFVVPPTRKGYTPRKVSYAPTVSVKKAP